MTLLFYYYYYFRECRPQTPGQQTVGYFGGHGVSKPSQQPGVPEEIPCEGTAEIALETERAAATKWPEHLKGCVEAEGGHFE